MIGLEVDLQFLADCRFLDGRRWAMTRLLGHGSLLEVFVAGRLKGRAARRGVILRSFHSGQAWAILPRLWAWLSDFFWGLGVAWFRMC